MSQKVDSIVDSYIGKFFTYHKSIDGLLGRTEDLLKRLDADNRASMSQTGNIDPLSRDIDLMRLRREFAIKAEDILTKVKVDVDREKLLPRFQEFRRILSSESPIYDDKSANSVYVSLAKELDSSIQGRPALKLITIVRDPYLNSSPLEIGPTPNLSAS